MVREPDGALININYSEACVECFDKLACSVLPLELRRLSVVGGPDDFQQLVSGVHFGSQVLSQVGPTYLEATPAEERALEVPQLERCLGLSEKALKDVPRPLMDLVKPRTFGILLLEQAWVRLLGCDELANETPRELQSLHDLVLRDPAFSNQVERVAQQGSSFRSEPLFRGDSFNGRDLLVTYCCHVSVLRTRQWPRAVIVRNSRVQSSQECFDFLLPSHLGDPPLARPRSPELHGLFAEGRDIFIGDHRL